MKYRIWFDVVLGNGALAAPPIADPEPTVGWLFHDDDEGMWDFTEDIRKAKQFDSAPEAFDAISKWMPDMQIIELKICLVQP
jgi:hypothetical protein